MAGDSAEPQHHFAGEVEVLRVLQDGAACDLSEAGSGEAEARDESVEGCGEQVVV
ncbi:hypothetical protein GCM10025876_37370 [Demequina litorisediminis]|uniref:Uncharacterized protein n=1 Tax=Demequina litorisediminis TaxID=1849022 RepID=A0ABQ6ILG2_9MICO|nr:hypothetical protein GCM10025876_37370 [Demequina litorisediminis]